MKVQLVPLASRLDFLPSITAEFTRLENLVYNTADDYGQSYNGAYWHFYDGEHEGQRVRYMAPKLSGMEEVMGASNYFKGSLSWDAFGIVCSLFALNALSWMMPNADDERDKVIDAYHALRRYASAHEEGEAILGAID